MALPIDPDSETSTPDHVPLDSRDILIVDDTVNNIRLIAEMLSLAGYSVRKAISGPMALTAVEANPPDLILLDITMPDMDGYEVCSRLKVDAKTRDIPIIFLSALDAAFDKVRALQLGGADYITKPFLKEEVLIRIENQLRLRQFKQDLETRNQDLENTLYQLKATQMELVQREKMLGLSQLISGIAHEVNNPISFIAGNLEPAEQYFETLVTLLDLYRQHYPDPEGEIKSAIATADLDFIVADFASLLKSIHSGTVRICDIVQALQTFSHQGESDTKTINLHATLDSILVLLQTRLRGQGNRPAIAVQCHYSDIPAVTCDAKLIGQVFMHLLNNAIDAIDALGKEDSGTSETASSPTLSIYTSVTDNQSVSVTIQDTGIGIAKPLHSRIYEPFFTTKSVGNGTGLGLAISYQIVVEKHKGSLSFESTPHQGSKFTVQLPIKFQG